MARDETEDDDAYEEDEDDAGDHHDDDGGPTAFQRFRTLAVGPLLLVLVGAGYSGFWWMASSTLQDQVNAWIELRRAEGYEIETGTMQASGFPISVSMRIPEPRITAPDDLGGWSWTGPAIRANVAIHDVSNVVINASGQHSLTYAEPDGTQSMLRADGGLIEGTVGFLESGALRNALLVLGDARLEGMPAGALSIRSGRFDAERIVADKIEHTDASITLKVDADGLMLPPAWRGALAPELERLRLRGAVLGKLPPGPFRKSLDQWRENGGSVRLSRLLVDWDPLNIQAEGSLALDEDLQPLGASTARVRGLFEGVDALTRSGVLRSSQASMVRVVLGMMAEPDPDGGASRISVPVTVQNGKVSLGPVDVYSFDPIEWPDVAPAYLDEEGLLKPGVAIDAEGNVSDGATDFGEDREERLEQQEQRQQEQQEQGQTQGGQ